MQKSILKIVANKVLHYCPVVDVSEAAVLFVLCTPNRTEQVAYHPRSVFVSQVSLCILHPNYHNGSFC
jgi:hypothetical protein